MTLEERQEYLEFKLAAKNELLAVKEELIKVRQELNNIRDELIVALKENIELKNKIYLATTIVNLVQLTGEINNTLQ